MTHTHNLFKGLAHPGSCPSFSPTTSLGGLAPRRSCPSFSPTTSFGGPARPRSCPSFSLVATCPPQKTSCCCCFMCALFCSTAAAHLSGPTAACETRNPPCCMLVHAGLAIPCALCNLVVIPDTATFFHCILLVLYSQGFRAPSNGFCPVSSFIQPKHCHMCQILVRLCARCHSSPLALVCPARLVCLCLPRPMQTTHPQLQTGKS